MDVDICMYIACCFSRNIQECAACALDDLFMKGFQSSLEKDLSERESLSPQFILEIIWRHCDSLASYAQHDAHEFFITFVNVLRQHIYGDNHSLKDETSKNRTHDIMDHLFSGVIESHVYCGGCKRYSVTFEDYFDISLDLNSSQEEEDRESIRTLQECLTYLTSPEKLDNGTTRYCDSCQQNVAFYKRVAIQKLPQILCFHLKRFQHGLDGKGVSSKVESEIGFPIDSLDISPYISSQILERDEALECSTRMMCETDKKEEQVVSQEETKQLEMLSKEPTESCSQTKELQTITLNSMKPAVEEEILYDLYAVVNHIGKMDHGHYITWIRERNNWFKCDDEIVTLEPFCTENMAYSSQVYLLFYRRRCG